jgi:hypothetical protein
MLCSASCLCCACGSSSASGGADAGSEGKPASCKPTPARCDALGDERPLRLSEHTAVYDQQRQEMIVFGGTDSVPNMCMLGGPTRYLFNTWIYDDVCGKWLRVEGQSPSPSGRHMAAIGDGSMWVFGGRFRDAKQTSGPYQIYSDLFRLDVAARRWHDVSVKGDPPPARSSGALVWDSKRHQLWLFGGNASTDGASYQPLADVWSFDPAAARWSERATSGSAPGARLFHAALYDEKRDALIIYGGANASALSSDARDFGDLWALSLGDLSWQQLHPGGGDAPDARFWSALVRDRARDAYLLFGGHDDGVLGNRNDSWSFDPKTQHWSNIAEGDHYQRPANGVCDFPPDFAAIEAGAPERRNAHTLVFSEGCGHALLFAGKTDCGAIDDLWSFDRKQWRALLPATEGEVCVRASSDSAQCSDLCTPPANP